MISLEESLNNKVKNCAKTKSAPEFFSKWPSLSSFAILEIRLYQWVSLHTTPTPLFYFPDIVGTRVRIFLHNEKFSIRK